MNTKKILEKIELRKNLKVKICKKCNIEKPIENFRIANKEKYIFECYCRKCKNKMRQARRRKGYIAGVPRKALSSEQLKDRNLKRKFGISLEYYLKMVGNQ